MGHHAPQAAGLLQDGPFWDGYARECVKATLIQNEKIRPIGEFPFQELA
jgi:hypothetical protein